MAEKRRTHAEKLRDELLKGAPELSEEEKRKMNGIFQAYIFRIRRTKEVWTSCCGAHKTLSGEISDAEYKLLTEEHTPEPIVRQYWTVPMNKYESERRVTCPYCGAEAKLKELGKTGNRHNLWSYRRCIVLRQKRGTLWAMAYEMVKNYDGRNPLDADRLMLEPETKKVGVYRFKAGSAAMTERPYWRGCYGYGNYPFGNAVEQNDGLRTVKKWNITAPFDCVSEYGMAYDVIGRDEIQKSDFRYCGVDSKELHGLDTIKLLTACAGYTRQIEMLHKAGLDQFIFDLVERKVRNADIIKWDGGGVRGVFGLSKQELLQFVSCGGYPEVLRLYKRERKRHPKLDMDTAAELYELLRKVDGESARRLLRVMHKCKASPRTLLGYIEKQNRKKGDSIAWYKDYLKAAEANRFDLENPLIAMPKDLKRKHDEAVEAYNIVLQREREERYRRWAAENKERRRQKDEKEKAKEKKRLRELARKYTYTDGKLLIRPPVDAVEIVDEGAALQHCVGGYAARHATGATTILFLRDRARPHVPLATIEIRGTEIVQIHGYRNEREASPENPDMEPLLEIYKDFLAGWLAWVEAGSKWPKKKKTKKADVTAA